MKQKADYHTPLLSGEIYHIFSRAVGGEMLFRNEENYLFFLSKLIHFTSPICDYFCYSLLPNHFHLLVQIKSDEIIEDYFYQKKNRTMKEDDNPSSFIMQQFSHCMNSYAKAYNKKYQRKGSLFMDSMKRSLVKQDSDFTNFVWYIHKNAVHHGLKSNVGEWYFDSYQSLLSDKKTLLQREKVLNWFDGKEGMIEFHKQEIELKINFEVSDL